MISAMRMVASTGAMKHIAFRITTACDLTAGGSHGSRPDKLVPHRACLRRKEPDARRPPPRRNRDQVRYRIDKFGLPH
jgi:hypothetical protein